MLRQLLISLSVSMLIVAAGCQDNKDSGDSKAKDIKAGAMVAVADVKPTTKGTAKGTVVFTQMGDKVMIVAHIEGLKPNSKHGFHIHEGTECGEDGMLAKGHFNPGGHQHAGPDKDQRHAGDLGNLQANDKGIAHLELTVSNITLGGDKPSNVVGRTVIVHANPDDFTTQPTGNAGDRIGCAVIMMKK